MNTTTIVIPNGSSIIIEDQSIHLLASLVIPIISILAVIITGILVWSYSKKQHERTALTAIFELLGVTHKSSEDNLYDAYKIDGTLMKDGKLDTNRNHPARTVRTNYDQIGSMISSRLIPSTEYYRSFGVLTVVSFFILKESIEQERKEHKFHMAHFTNLAIDCFNFWNDQKEESRIKITDPDTK